MTEPNIHDYSQLNYSQMPYSTSVGQTSSVSSGSESQSQVDNTASTIEKSKSVVVPYTPLLNFPVLMTPQANGDMMTSMVSGIFNDKDGKVIESLLLSQQLRMNSLTNEVLDSWNKNLQEISEQVKDMIKSSAYQQNQDFQLRVEPQQQVISAGIVNALEGSRRLLNDIITHDVVKEDAIKKEGEDSNKTEVISMMITSVVMGAVVVSMVDATVPLNAMSGLVPEGTYQVISQVQTFIPKDILADTILTINLMVMPLIYYTSWDAAVSSIRGKDRENRMEMAEKFAKEVIRLVGDPTLIQGTIIAKVKEAQLLPAEQQEQLMAMIKLILAVNALAVLYIAEAGKGTPEEILGNLVDMLKGEIPIPEGTLQATLFRIIQGQLEALPESERVKIMEALFDYLDHMNRSNSFEEMLEPSKVFRHVLQTSVFNPDPYNVEFSRV
jgi:hypothetical protein